VSTHQNMQNIHAGMMVHMADGQQLGKVERMQGTTLLVKGQSIPQSAVARVTKDGVYLDGSYAAGQQAGEIRVPVAEERLNVGKREAELGEVQIRKTVTEEQQTIPVTLQRDEVHVEERDIADRPLRAGEDAFSEGTIRVAVRGEEAVVAKEAIVTGEVVIDKQTTREERQVSGTVRKQHVEVDENYRQARAGFEQEFRGSAKSKGRTFEQAEPNYRAGFTAAYDERHAGRSFEEVEPELRQAHSGADNWEQLREEVRSGWNRARS